MQQHHHSFASGRCHARRLGLCLAVGLAMLGLACGDSEDSEDWEDGAWLEDMPGDAEGFEDFGGGFPTDVGAAPPDPFPPDELGYGGYDDSDDLEPDDDGLAFQYEGYDEGGGVQGGYDEGQGEGWGGDAGGFRGQAEVGGSPIVSGTIDQSGEGNHVFSVGGEVLELP